MRSAQKQALDKLYVTEFKSFVAGKIVSSIEDFRPGTN
jgi:hypothetical protein